LLGVIEVQVGPTGRGRNPWWSSKQFGALVSEEGQVQDLINDAIAARRVKPAGAGATSND
jgi:hypothetical protein